MLVSKYNTFILLILLVSFSIFGVGCNRSKSSNSDDNSNTWIIGTWSTLKSDNVELKLTLNPDGDCRLFMIGNWLECTYEIYDKTLITTINDINVQFKLDKTDNKLFTVNGNELNKW